MGGTCSPEQNETQNENEKSSFTKLINDYQTDNERLKQQLEKLISRNQEGTTEHQEKAKQNEEVMKELAAMKKILEQKDRALVKGQLEAVLRSKATTMLSIEPKTRLCMEGTMRHHGSGLTKSKKVKHVEVLLTEGEWLTTEYKAGFVMLTYAESKGSKTAKRCQVLEVILNKYKSYEVILQLNVLAEGALKQIAFTCETGDNKDEWVKCITDALNEVRTTWELMNEEFTVMLDVTKEKIGMRVEAIFADEIEHYVKEKEGSDKFERTMRKAARDDVVEENKEQVYPEVNTIAKDAQVEEQIKLVKPCALMVQKILDEDLVKEGLFENCIVSKINDTDLVGMVWSDQIDLLKSTPKPFTITFTGKNFVKKKGAPTHVYFSILKELVADGANEVKKAFHDLVKGTSFETELQCSINQGATIEALLSDQRRLMALLQNLPVQEMEL